MAMTGQRQPRAPKGVLVYGIGTVGTAVSRLAASHGWRVTGANRAGPKVGSDFGKLVEVPSLEGTSILDADRTDFGALDVDVAVVAVHDRLAETLMHHRRLLEAGLNVICLGAESSFPHDVDTDVAAEIDAMARANGVTFTGCGLWDAYRIWTLKTLAGPCTSIGRIHHQSVTDVLRFGPEVLRIARVVEDPAEFGAGADSERSIYRVFLSQAVTSLGLTVKSVEERQEPVLFDQPIPCPHLDKDVPAGVCAGTRTVIQIETEEGVSALAEIDLRLTLPSESEWMGWRIEGTPPVEMRLEGLDTGHATASSAVNRVPDVIAAPAGLVSCDQLAPMRFTPTPNSNTVQ